MAGLGDILVAHGVLDADQLAQAEAHQQESGSNLTRSLLELKLASESDLVRAFAVSLDRCSWRDSEVSPAAAYMSL